MKKKIILMVLLIVIVAASVLYIKSNIRTFNSSYLATRDDGSKAVSYSSKVKAINDEYSFNFSGFTGKWSLINLDSPKGNEITIENNSKISKGEFDVVVLDANYKIAGNVQMDSNSSKKNINFQANGDKYIIRIVGINASGSFDVKINGKQKLDIVSNNFFNN